MQHLSVVVRLSLPDHVLGSVTKPQIKKFIEDAIMTASKEAAPDNPMKDNVLWLRAMGVKKMA